MTPAVTEHMFQFGSTSIHQLFGHIRTVLYLCLYATVMADCDSEKSPFVVPLIILLIDTRIAPYSLLLHWLLGSTNNKE
ncbi:hypothetical protein BU24DRAFT_118800 [Aaosphaeria arxii CBS 175.79]|uniref:Uncharacterized protein n=1 Tax=Aaosphaeria arxii CBS 175.79 TaxID=1450172 RepID=A0A6A5Y4E5_9PLEO|nr:uncharacterized protein BU24DRAFT_118800 [Aaosphaeria arxii CBS 175.79]KAF2019384.1 hypothetical protein BU24DRAFT_118800 [Aaosphaeria arxii CBS 175.79]